MALVVMLFPARVTPPRVMSWSERRPSQRLTPGRDLMAPTLGCRGGDIAVGSVPHEAEVCCGSRAAVIPRLMVRSVCPQLRKCRVRPGGYAWCQLPTSGEPPLTAAVEPAQSSTWVTAQAPKLPPATSAESGGAGWAAQGEGRQPRLLHPLQMAKVAMSRQMFADIPSLIAWLRAPVSLAGAARG